MRVLSAVSALLLVTAVHAATLTVTVQAVGPKGGILRLSLYDEAGWTKDDDTPLYSANVPAVVPETVVTFADVKPGVYGIKLFQDANSNGKFDQNFIGLPLERFGFSRDARPFLSQPGFDRTRFTVGDGDTAIAIHLQ